MAPPFEFSHKVRRYFARFRERKMAPIRAFFVIAETERFELSIGFTLCLFSKQVTSTTRPRFLILLGNVIARPPRTLLTPAYGIGVFC